MKRLSLEGNNSKRRGLLAEGIKNFQIIQDL
jgi:hypothetical protein